METVTLLGPVETISKSRLILVKIEKQKIIPKIGSKVVDVNGQEVGRIIDIIGSVDKPYAVVKPSSYTILSLIEKSAVLFYRSINYRKSTKRR